MAGPTVGSLGHFSFDRTPRDRRWAVAFAAFWVVCLMAGAYISIVQRPRRYSAAAIAKLPASACPREWLSSQPHGRRSLLAAVRGEPQQAKHAAVAATTGVVWMAVSICGSLLLGAAFLWLFRRHTERAVHVTMALMVALPLAGAVACLASLVAGARPDVAVRAAIALLVFGLVNLGINCTGRNQVPATVRLLRMSADCMAANPALVRVAAAMCVAFLAAVAPLGWFLVALLRSGSLVANPARGGRPECLNSRGLPVPCCDFMPSGWAIVYALIPLPFLIVWTLFMAAQARLFVISGAVAQWYFAPAGEENATRGTTLRSLRHAFGPQLGTVCFAGAVIAVAQYVKSLADSMQRRGGLLGCLLSYPLRWAAVALQELTKFAVITAAITGEGLKDAGRRTLELLKRNALEAFTTAFWLAPWTVGLTSLLVALAWGALNTAAAALLSLAGGTIVAWDDLLAFGSLHFFSCLLIVGFLGGVLLEVLDACFVCWALDRDSSAVSKPEVHSAFNAVPAQPLRPAAGVAVEQPGGGLAYGAAQAQAAAARAEAAAALAASGPARDEEAAQQLRPLLSPREPRGGLELTAA